MKAFAQFTYDKRRFVLIAWIVGLVLIFGISSAVQGEHRTDFSLPQCLMSRLSLSKFSIASSDIARTRRRSK